MLVLVFVFFGDPPDGTSTQQHKKQRTLSCTHSLHHTMQVTDDITKPERDTRLYRRITFPNGLEALLISDPSLVRVRLSTTPQH